MTTSDSARNGIGRSRAEPAPAGEADRRLSRPPRWALGAILLAMGVLVGLTLVTQIGQHASVALLTVDYVCAGAALALLPWLLRDPPPAAVLLAVLAALSPTATPPATLGVLTVAQRRPLRDALVVAAIDVAAHAVRGGWRPVGGLSYTWWLVLDVVAHAALVGVGALLRAQQSLLWSLRERAAAAEAEQARKIAEARMAERTRIAREMHDVLAHRLSLLATHAGALEYRPDAPPERLAAAAGVVRAGVHDALEDLRAVIGVLRADDPHAAGGGDPADAPPGGPPHTRRPQPTLADLPALVEESRAAGMPIELVDTVDAAQPVPAMAGRTAYRIVQEGLTNARKHAPGSPVTVEVSGGPGSGVSVTVSNPRRPGPAASIPGTGTGLVGLAERARLAGGHLEHTVAADGGFRVTAWLPWPE